MAFLRDYMQGTAGDPRRFHFRAPRFLRKLQPFKLAARAAQFVPGPIGTAASFLGDPGPKRQKNKRKSAGSGPRAKAANKRAHRGGLGALAGQAAGFIGEHAGTIGQLAGGAIGLLGGPAGAVAGAGLGGAIGEAAGELVPVGRPALGLGEPAGGELIPGAHRMGRAPRVSHLAHRKVDAWMVKPRRAVNPSNVKALRRSVRRIESFEHLVRSVQRAYPRLKHAQSMHAGGRRSGHRAGCGCFACKKRSRS